MRFTITDLLRSLDIFSEEPKTLAFGDPNDKRSRNMYKTSCGGIVSIAFIVFVILYVIMQLGMVYGEDAL